MVRNNSNTIFDVEQLMCRRFDDKAVQDGMKTWPITLVNVDDVSLFKTSLKTIIIWKKYRKTICWGNIQGRENVFAPEDISSLILVQLEKDFEIWFGKKVRNCKKGRCDRGSFDLLVLEMAENWGFFRGWVNSWWYQVRWARFHHENGGALPQCIPSQQRHTRGKLFFSCELYFALMKFWNYKYLCSF